MYHPVSSIAQALQQKKKTRRDLAGKQKMYTISALKSHWQIQVKLSESVKVQTQLWSAAQWGLTKMCFCIFTFLCLHQQGSGRFRPSWQTARIGAPLQARQPWKKTSPQTYACAREYEVNLKNFHIGQYQTTRLLLSPFSFIMQEIALNS